MNRSFCVINACMRCDYCKEDVIALSLAGHLRKCLIYLKLSRKNIQKCPCGYKPNNLLDRRLHRDSCLTWKNKYYQTNSNIICSKCKIKKNSNEFYNNRIKRNGKDSKCKLCRIESRTNKYSNQRIKEVRRFHYLENIEDILKQKQDFYYNNQDLFIERRAIYRENHKSEINQKIKIWRNKNTEILKERSKNYRDEIINLVLDELGHVCKLCGEQNREFLTIDHIHNNGNMERKLSSLGWKRKILSGEFPKENYQVLCHNCNQKKYKQNPVHHFSRKELVGENKRCHGCKLLLDLSMFSSQKSHSKNFCLLCKLSKKKEKQKQFLLSIGTACQCCGKSDSDVLVLDHKNNDGNMRRQNGERSGIDLYKKVYCGELNKEDFQILCWNCNYSKHYGKGLCWHQRQGKSLFHKPTSKSIALPTNINNNQTDFEFDSVITKSFELNDEIRKFLDNNHYAKFGRPSRIIYVAILGKEIIGVSKFAAPIRQGVAPSLGVLHNEVFELDRFCVHPNYHKKNFASFFMAKILKLVAFDFKQIKKLVSFADPRFGHIGTIYKATNWKYIGETSKSYYYIDENDMEINKKTLYEYAKIHNLKERECAEILNYKKVHTPPKHKYVYEL